jgi:hypothetical protein
MWVACFSAYLSNSDLDELLPFAPELLPAAAEAGGARYEFFFAETRRSETGEEKEVGDRWVQAGHVMAIARSAFDEALRSVPPSSHDSQCTGNRS